MKELWEKAINLLPAKSKIDCFYIEYRPWVRNQAHVYRVFFRVVGAYTDRPTSTPLWVTGFGNSPEKALLNFITKWNNYD